MTEGSVIKSDQLWQRPKSPQKKRIVAAQAHRPEESSKPTERRLDCCAQRDRLTLKHFQHRRETALAQAKTNGFTSVSATKSIICASRNGALAWPWK